MRFAGALLLALVALAIACLDPEPTPLPTPSVTGETPEGFAPTPLPTPSVTGETPEGFVPTPLPTLTPLPTPTPGPAPMPMPSDFVARIELPLWMEWSQKMARYLIASEVIARARFVSVDSAVEPHRDDYVVRLTYMFEILEYLKGSGADKLVVRIRSVPKVLSIPDVIGYRTKEEARELAEQWLPDARRPFADQTDGILFLNRGAAYSFTGSEVDWDRGDRFAPTANSPIIGRAWLPQEGTGTYWHEFADDEPGTISLEEIKARIEDIDPRYSSCLGRLLRYVDEVARRIRGTYRELSIGGFYKPDPYRKREGAISRRASPAADRAAVTVRNPPQRTPRFSYYWLDGEDEDRFTLEVSGGLDDSFQELHEVGVLAPGQYSVHVSSFHSALPCKESGGWWDQQTTEWVITVTP